MNIFALRHYRSAYGLMRAVSSLNFGLPAKIYLRWPGGLDYTILRAPNSIQ
jgi:hypothetical protein